MKLLTDATHAFFRALTRKHEHADGKRAKAEVPVLLIAASDLDRTVLHELLDNTRWRITSVACCEEALETLRSRTIPIVLCDRDLPGVHWRQTVNILRSVSYPVSIIVTSQVTDSYLWNAVVDQGGFGVLAKPFGAADVLQTLEFAFSDWSMQLPRSQEQFKNSDRVQRQG
jgi:DNA-binding NtrC family response regulator